MRTKIEIKQHRTQAETFEFEVWLEAVQFENQNQKIKGYVI